MKVTSLRYLDAKFRHPSPKIKKKIRKNTNGRLAIPALAGLLVVDLILVSYVMSIATHKARGYVAYVFYFLPTTKEEVYVFALTPELVCLSVVYLSMCKITHKRVHGFG